VLHHLPALKFLDSNKVREWEKGEARRRGQFMKVVRPNLSNIDENSRNNTISNPFTPLPKSIRSPDDFRGIYYGSCVETKCFIFVSLGALRIILVCILLLNVPNHCKLLTQRENSTFSRNGNHNFYVLIPELNPEIRTKILARAGFMKLKYAVCSAHMQLTVLLHFQALQTNTSLYVTIVLFKSQFAVL
jgi:hypothetical protein